MTPGRGLVGRPATARQSRSTRSGTTPAAPRGMDARGRRRRRSRALVDRAAQVRTASTRASGYAMAASLRRRRWRRGATIPIAGPTSCSRSLGHQVWPKPVDIGCRRVGAPGHAWGSATLAPAIRTTGESTGTLGRATPRTTKAPLAMANGPRRRVARDHPEDAHTPDRSWTLLGHLDGRASVSISEILRAEPPSRPADARAGLERAE